MLQKEWRVLTAEVMVVMTTPAAIIRVAFFIAQSERER